MNTIQPLDWLKIRKVVADSQRTAMHCSISTMTAAGYPTISPIGTLFLAENQPAGFFFDRYCTSLQQNLLYNPKACIQAVNSSRIFWLKCLIRGNFSNYPGVRLYAEIGALRAATPSELALVQRRIRPLAWTKGSQLIWSEFSQVRDIQVLGFKWVEYPQMRPKFQT